MSKKKVVFYLCIMALLSGVIISRITNRESKSIKENIEVLSDPEWFDLYTCYKLGFDEYGNVYICPGTLDGNFVPIDKCSNPYGNIYYSKADTARCYL